MRGDPGVLLERLSEIGIAHVDGAGNVFRCKLVVNVFPHQYACFLDLLHGGRPVILVFANRIDQADRMHHDSRQDSLESCLLCLGTVKHFAEMLDYLVIYADMENGSLMVDDLIE